MGALQDKVALVTGASSGLGAETARLLSQQGATVFGIGRKPAATRSSSASVNSAVWMSWSISLEDTRCVGRKR